MFGTRWQLFRLLGIPVSADASWLIILALLTLNLATGFPSVLHDYFPGATQLAASEYWVMGLITALAFFGCILLHEFGHAVVARARGMPISGITLFLFGGVAELGDEPPSAKTEFLMAIAGPAVSVILAIVFWLLAVAGYHLGWPHQVVIVFGYLGDQCVCPGFQPRSRVPARRRPGAVLDPVGNDRQFAELHVLGLAGGP